MSESIDLGSGSDSGSTAELTAVRYAIDGRISRFTVRAFASGMLSAFGHSPTIAIRDFAGEAQFNPDQAGKCFVARYRKSRVAHGYRRHQR